MMSAIWQFIKKHEFWFLIAICIGFYIAHVKTDDALFANIGFVIFMVAGLRLSMHPMWKKDEKAEADE